MPALGAPLLRVWPPIIRRSGQLLLCEQSLGRVPAHRSGPLVGSSAARARVSTHSLGHCWAEPASLLRCLRVAKPLVRCTHRLRLPLPLQGMRARPRRTPTSCCAPQRPGGCGRGAPTCWDSPQAAQIASPRQSRCCWRCPSRGRRPQLVPQHLAAPQRDQRAGWCGRRPAAVRSPSTRREPRPRVRRQILWCYSPGTEPRWTAGCWAHMRRSRRSSASARWSCPTSGGRPAPRWCNWRLGAAGRVSWQQALHCMPDSCPTALRTPHCDRLFPVRSRPWQGGGRPRAGAGGRWQRVGLGEQPPRVRCCELLTTWCCE